MMAGPLDELRCIACGGSPTKTMMLNVKETTDAEWPSVFVAYALCDDCDVEMCSDRAIDALRVLVTWTKLARNDGLSSADETPPAAHGLRVTDDRVLIRADREDHAPTQTEAGVYLATSLAAAVEGEDPEDSWFVGTIVQVGPLVNWIDARETACRWIVELEDHEHDASLAELRALRARIEAMPQDTPDPLRVGDRVAFSWASGQQITMDGDRFLILRAGDVLAVLEE